MMYWLIFIIVNAQYPVATVTETIDLVACQQRAAAAKYDPESVKFYCVPKTTPPVLFCTYGSAFPCMRLDQ